MLEKWRHAEAKLINCRPIPFSGYPCCLIATYKMVFSIDSMHLNYFHVYYAEF